MVRGRLVSGMMLGAFLGGCREPSARDAAPRPPSPPPATATVTVGAVLADAGEPTSSKVAPRESAAPPRPLPPPAAGRTRVVVDGKELPSFGAIAGVAVDVAPPFKAAAVLEGRGTPAASFAIAGPAPRPDAAREGRAGRRLRTHHAARRRLLHVGARRCRSVRVDRCEEGPCGGRACDVPIHRHSVTHAPPMISACGRRRGRGGPRCRA